jgi:hypothetical protein
MAESELFGIGLNRAIACARGWTVRRKDWETEQEARLYRNQYLWEFFDEDGNYVGIVLAENEEVAWVEAWRHDGDNTTALPDWAYDISVSLEECDWIVENTDYLFKLVCDKSGWQAGFYGPDLEVDFIEDEGSYDAEAVARLLLAYYLKDKED